MRKLFFCLALTALIGCTIACTETCMIVDCSDHDLSCECKDGYYGANCTLSCPTCATGKCKKDTGDCTCVNGTCACAPTCRDNLCDPGTGECLGCADGYYGKKCDMDCPINCTEGLCQQETGECQSGGICGGVSYGPNCSIPCNCFNESPCSPVTGHCPEGCAPGYQGDPCVESNKICQDGYFGHMCQMQCLKSCKEGTCDQVTGDCERDCGGRRFGTECESECHCKDAGPCDPVSGECPEGCALGYSGTTCSDGCEAGKWGASCSKDCDEACENSCNTRTGECPHESGVNLLVVVALPIGLVLMLLLIGLIAMSKRKSVRRESEVFTPNRQSVHEEVEEYSLEGDETEVGTRV